MTSPMRWLLLAFSCASLAGAGCSWHRPGEAETVAPPDPALADPAPGASLAEVIALAETREGDGSFSVEADLERVAQVQDGIWQDVSQRSARRASALRCAACAARSTRSLIPITGCTPVTRLGPATRSR